MSVEQHRRYQYPISMIDKEKLSLQPFFLRRPKGNALRKTEHTAGAFSKENVSSFQSINQDLINELIEKNRLLNQNQTIAKQGGWQFEFHSRKFTLSLEAAKIIGLESSKNVMNYHVLFSMIAQNERENIQAIVDAALNKKETFSVSYRAYFPDKSVKYILNQGEPIFNEWGEPEVMLGVVQDITQVKHAEYDIRKLAYYDGLTGLANRMLFQNRLHKTISSFQRSNKVFALLFIDLDNFKTVNDTMGHHAGDLVLKQISRAIKSSIRCEDTASIASSDSNSSMVARMGGDEFVLILTDIENIQNIASVSKRILSAICKPILIEGEKVCISASAGISIFPEDGCTPELLLKKADTAMYHAKSSGRNSFQFFKQSLNTATIERSLFEQDLKNALIDDQFCLFFQPQIST